MLKSARRAAPEDRCDLIEQRTRAMARATAGGLHVRRFAQAEIRRLEELRQVALGARIDADLELGRHADVVGELEALVAEHPLRETFYRQLMLALYRGGARQKRSTSIRLRRLASSTSSESSRALSSVSYRRRSSATRPRSRPGLRDRVVTTTGRSSRPLWPDGSSRSRPGRRRRSRDAPGPRLRRTERPAGRPHAGSQYVATMKGSGRCTTSCTSASRQPSSRGRSTGSCHGSHAPAGAWRALSADR